MCTDQGSTIMRYPCVQSSGLIAAVYDGFASCILPPHVCDRYGSDGVNGREMRCGFLSERQLALSRDVLILKSIPGAVLILS
jgi:hypothetical protein